MNPDSWAFASTTVITVGGIIGIYLQSRKQHQENKRAADELRKKVDPISNGFATHVRNDIKELREMFEREAFAAARDRAGLGIRMAELEGAFEAHITTTHRRKQGRASA